MVEGRLIPKPLAWAQVRDSFAAAAPLLQERLREDRHASRDAAAFKRERREGPARRAAHGTIDAILEGPHMNVGFIGLGTMGAPMARNI